MTTMSYGPLSKTSGLTSNGLIPPSNGLNGDAKQKPLDPVLERQMISWINENYRKMKEDRSRIEIEWLLNMSFYFGDQWVTSPGRGTKLNSTALGTRLILPNVPPWVTRLVVNRIRPAVRTEHSKLTSQKPTANIVPASSDDKDYFAAQAGEQFWESIYRAKKLRKVFSRAAWWTCITGTGIVKAWWDPNEIDKYNNIKGDMCYSSVTPFHFLVPDLREEELEDQPYAFHIQTRDIDWVNMRYPELKGVKPDTDSVTDILDDAIINIKPDNSNKRQRTVMVKECWIKPGNLPQLPDGGVITLIGDKIAQFWQGWPYDHYCYPFAKIDHIPTGRFYSQSSVVDLRPLQKELNRTRSQIVEAKNQMAKPRLLAYRGSIDPSKITTQPGQIILVVPGFDMPQPLPMPPLPSYVGEEIERLVVDFNDISGQHEVTKGQAPPGVTAATAISYLQEQDESMLSQTYASLEDAIEKVGVMTLGYVKQYWTIPRMVKVSGIDGSFDSMIFSSATIGDNTDIRIEAGSSLPTSKAAKMAFIMDLMKMGFIPPQQGLEVMDMGGLNKITEQIQKDNKQAQRENLKMSQATPEQMQQYSQLQMQMAQIDPITKIPANPKFQGPPDPTTGQPTILNPPPMVPVNTWDNHQLHIQKHNDFRKSQAFEQLQPEVKDLFEAHVQDHMAALSQQFMQQQMMGAPPQQGQQQSSGSAELPKPQPEQGQLEQGGMPNGSEYGQP